MQFQSETQFVFDRRIPARSDNAAMDDDLRKIADAGDLCRTRLLLAHRVRRTRLPFLLRMPGILSRQPVFKALALAMMLTFSLAACAPKVEPSRRILGKWRADDGFTVQFFENGTMVLSYAPQSKFHGKQDAGIWTLMAGNKIKVSAEGFNEPSHDCAVTFLEGDRLLVKGSDGVALCMTHETSARP